MEVANQGSIGHWQPAFRPDALEFPPRQDAAEEEPAYSSDSSSDEEEEVDSPEQLQPLRRHSPPEELSESRSTQSLPPIAQANDPSDDSNRFTPALSVDPHKTTAAASPAGLSWSNNRPLFTGY